MAPSSAIGTAILGNGLSTPMGGGGGFSPSDVAGLVGWYKADGVLWQDSARTTPAVSDADPVGAWDDASSVGAHLLQATAGLRPLLKLAIQNGRNVIRFDGTDDKIAMAGGLLYSQPNHIFVVCQWSSVAAATKVVDGVTNRNALYHQTTEHRMFAGSEYSSVVAPDTSWHQFSCLFSGAASVFRRDQVASAAGDASTAGMRDPIVGCDSGGAAQFFPGDAAEILIYNAALSGANLSNVETYLKDRWGTP